MMDIFRELNKSEINEFKKWARDNYEPGSDVNEVWHPVVRLECDVINQETWDGISCIVWCVFKCTIKSVRFSLI